MVEFVDLYPTLCELCQIPQPARQLDGQSFAKVFSNLKAKTKDEVYIQWEGETMRLINVLVMPNG